MLILSHSLLFTSKQNAVLFGDVKPQKTVQYMIGNISRQIEFDKLEKAPLDIDRMKFIFQKKKKKKIEP
jgi:hypothetical protein